MRPLAAASLLVLAALLLAGCSMVRLAYDNADSYLQWRIGGYFDLQGEATDALDAAIQDFLDWHRAKELPHYARLAEEAAVRLDDGLSPGDLVWGYDAFESRGRLALRTAAERVAPVLARLTPAQIAHFERRLAEDNRRFAREHLRGSERARRERRAERIVERVEDWVGRLSQAQVARIRRYSNETPLLGEMRARDNRRVQAALLGILREGEVEARLPALAERWREGRESAYAAAIEAGRRELFALLLELDHTLSTEQRGAAQAQLRRYGADFQRLAGRR